MKKNPNSIKTLTYMGGMITIAAAALLVIFLAMSILGLIHPRKTRITLHTDHISAVYDGNTHVGSGPVIVAGKLSDGHVMEVRSVTRFCNVGTYKNAPDFVIVDETGADVTQQYDIQCNYGDIIVQPKQISLACGGGKKIYDGEPLRSGTVELVFGSLIEGHSLVVEGGNSLLYPGSVRTEPNYRIVNEQGADVTDQYHVTELFDELVIEPHILQFSTGSAEKLYDGTDLSCDEWKMTGGKLLEGHNLDVRVTGILTDAGITHNRIEVQVYDAGGVDVTQIYDIQCDFGILQIRAIPLHIKTMSSSKIYDGTPLSCSEWELTNGSLESGATLCVFEYAIHDKIGTVENAIRFGVMDQNGLDVSHRYDIVCDYGELTLQPRALTLRTATASKVYDGTILEDHSFTIISGELCEGDIIELRCVTLDEVGYTDNYVTSCVVYRLKENGQMEDVTAYYRINFEYGSLEITAK